MLANAVDLYTGRSEVIENGELKIDNEGECADVQINSHRSVKLCVSSVFFSV